jgi:hypothetical protein
MESLGDGVFKLMRPQEKELACVRKFDDEFERGGYFWQAFKICSSKGLVKSQNYHFCCMGCGNYIRTSLKNKMTFNTEHLHIPLEDRNDLADSDTGNIEEDEAPPVLLCALIKFICHSTLPFVQGSSEFLSALVREAIILARAFPLIPPELLFPELSAAKLSEHANFMGFNKQSILLDEMRGKKVSILLDAGKGMISFLVFFFFSFLVLKGRYIVLLLCRVGSRKPFFYYDFYTGAMDTPGYAKLAAKTKIILKSVISPFYFE